MPIMLMPSSCYYLKQQFYELHIKHRDCIFFALKKYNKSVKCKGFLLCIRYTRHIHIKSFDPFGSKVCKKKARHNYNVQTSSCCNKTQRSICSSYGTITSTSYLIRRPMLHTQIKNTNILSLKYLCLVLFSKRARAVQPSTATHVNHYTVCKSFSM